MTAAVQLALDLPPGSSPSLGNFVPGPNTEVLATLNRWVGGDRRTRTVHLWGQPASGKSHLAIALAAATAAESGGSRLLTPDSALSDFAPAPQQVRPPVAAPVGLPIAPHFSDERGLAAHAEDSPAAQAGAGTDAGARARQDGPTEVGVVVVDDVDRLDPARQQALFGLINRVRDDPRALLLTTGAGPPRALALRDDLRSRLAWGLVFELALLPDNDKVLALQALASERGVMMSAEVVPYLLTHTSRDMRQLIGLFDALDRLALQRQRAITVPLVRDLLQGPLAKE